MTPSRAKLTKIGQNHATNEDFSVTELSRNA
jgi:hypothetical protein